MYISKLSLVNYRAAQSVQIDDMDDRLNVFVGVNGAGKSTILDAATVMLSSLLYSIESFIPEVARNDFLSNGIIFNNEDIRIQEQCFTIKMWVREGDEFIPWEVSKKRNRPLDIKSLGKNNNLVDELVLKFKNRAGSPLFVYYMDNRAVSDNLILESKDPNEFANAYAEVFSRNMKFEQFFEWFKNREDIENEKFRHDANYIDMQLDAVRKALSAFMPDFSDFRIRRDLNIRMVARKNGIELSTQQFSSGEKHLVALVGDLARRLAIANPSLDNPLDGNGIVMIDEIDLHLHPKWQRMVVPQLLKTFTNCQFLITTHSPHVINHIHHKKIFLLEQNANGEMIIKRPSESYGKNVDRILEDLMGLETTRPDDVDEALRDIASKIQNGELASAKEKIEEIREKIGEDPDLISSSVLIKRKELIGK